MPTDERLPMERHAAKYLLKFMEKHEIEDQEMWQIIEIIGILQKECGEFWDNFCSAEIDYIRSIARGDK